MASDNALRYYRKKDAPPPLKLLECNVARIEIGPERNPYFIHKDLLCHYSQYFDAALNGAFNESETQTVTLDEEDVKFFRRVFHWLYTGGLQDSSETQDNKFQSTLTNIWLFGDRRSMPALQNHCLDALRDDIVAVWGVNTDLERIFARAPPSAGVRRFVIEVYTKNKGAKLFQEIVDRIQKNYGLQTLADFNGMANQRLWERIEAHYVGSHNRDALQKLQLCKFHEHQKASQCEHLKIEDEKFRRVKHGT